MIERELHFPDCIPAWRDETVTSSSAKSRRLWFATDEQAAAARGDAAAIFIKALRSIDFVHDSILQCHQC
jgi:hypothetical protein